MSSGKVNPSQKFSYLQTGVILQKCVILPLKRFELRSYGVMLHLGWLKLQLGLKPLRCKLTHSILSIKTVIFLVPSQYKQNAVLGNAIPVLGVKPKQGWYVFWLCFQDKQPMFSLIIQKVSTRDFH